MARGSSAASNGTRSNRGSLQLQRPSLQGKIDAGALIAIPLRPTPLDRTLFPALQTRWTT